MQNSTGHKIPVHCQHRHSVNLANPRCGTPLMASIKPPTQSCEPVDSIVQAPVKFAPKGVIAGNQSQNNVPVAGFIDIRPCSGTLPQTVCCRRPVPKWPPS